MRVLKEGSPGAPVPAGLVLAKHGLVALGRTMGEAASRAELIEETAKIAALAHLLGGAGG
jgi:ribulose-5-phosphate 4-epimerase/fuculose-1-phosphate aldolase